MHEDEAMVGIDGPQRATMYGQLQIMLQGALLHLDYVQPQTAVTTMSNLRPCAGIPPFLGGRGDAGRFTITRVKS